MADKDDKVKFWSNDATKVLILGGDGENRASSSNPIEMSASIDASDIQIGAVEIKDADTNVRATVKDGSTFSTTDDAVGVADANVLANLGTIETDIEATNTTLTDGTQKTQVLPNKTPVSEIVTAQNLTNSYADAGSEIDMEEYSTVGVFIDTDVNDSENVTLKVLGRHTSGGTAYEIDGLSEKTLWTTGASDGSIYYEFDAGAIPFLQLQVKAGNVGTTPGDVTINITKRT